MTLRSRNTKTYKWGDGVPKKVTGILQDIAIGENDRGPFRIYRGYDRGTKEPWVFFGVAQLDGARKDGAWLENGKLRAEDVGHYIEVDYLGKKTNRRGNPEHDFNVLVDDQPEERYEQLSLFDSEPPADPDPEPFEAAVPPGDPEPKE